jgi:hypothetical protein
MSMIHRFGKKFPFHFRCLNSNTEIVENLNSKDETALCRNKIQLKVLVKFADGKELLAPFGANEFCCDYRRN